MSVCCLPASPCSGAGALCRLVPTQDACASLAKQVLPFSQEDASSCNEASRPEWAAVFSSFCLVPLGVLLAAAALWGAVLGPLYGALLRRQPGLNRFVVTHVGRLGQPHPRSVSFMAWMSRAQIVASLFTLAIFVFKTSRRRVPKPVWWLEGALGAFFTAHYFLISLKYEFRLHFLLEAGQLVDVFTVPGMLMREGNETEWLSLDFLRSIQALLAYERLCGLGGGRLGEEAGPVRHELLRLAARFLAPIICCASLVLVLEVLGDPPFLGSSYRIPTGMGELDFFTLIYWVIETVSTVGYGDFTPHTGLSRMVTVFGMFSGIAFVTIAASKMLDILSKQNKGTGTFEKSHREHVVLVGGGVKHVDESLLLAFAEELYHTTYRNTWPDLVVMSSAGESLEKIRSLFERSLDSQACQYITYLVGTPLNVVDLERGRCDVAKLVVIMADTMGHVDPVEEDKENLLRALSLKNAFPETPLRLMLLMYASKEKAFSVGIRPQKCFSVNEMKNSLFWQATRCTGWSTLLSNLMVTTTDEVPKEELKDKPWLENYVLGMGHEVYGMLPADEFLGKPFGHLVREAYKRNGICVFAAQMEGAVVLAPLRQLEFLTLGTPIFALAQDEEALQGIASTSAKVDWKDVFQQRMNYHIMSQDYDARSQQGSEEEEVGVRGIPSIPSVEGFVEDRSLRRHHSRVEEGLQASLHGYRLSVPAEDDDWASEEMQSEVTSDRSSRVMQHVRTSRRGLGTVTQVERDERNVEPEPSVMRGARLEQIESIAAQIRGNSILAPFILVLELSGSWAQAVPFIMRSRDAYLPFRRPMIILCRSAPPRQLEQDLGLGMDENVGFVHGSPNRATDLVRAGIRECSTVVCLGQSSLPGAEQGALSRWQHGEGSAMLDADVVMQHRTIQHLGVSGKSAIFEFKRAQNMVLVRSSFARTRRLRRSSSRLSLRRKPSHSALEEAKERLSLDRGWAQELLGSMAGGAAIEEPQYNDAACLDPLYASGQVFMGQALGSLLGLAFHTPGLIEVMQALIVPEGGVVDSALPWQVRLGPDQAMRTYGEILATLTSDHAHPILPLGMYRQVGMAPGHGNKGYVWTNPPASTRMLPSDVLYVLGDQRFGKFAYGQNLLPGCPVPHWVARQSEKRNSLKAPSANDDRLRVTLRSAASSAH